MRDTAVKIPAISAEPDAPLVCGAGQFKHGAGCPQCPENTFRYCYFEKFIVNFYSFELMIMIFIFG